MQTTTRFITLAAAILLLAPAPSSSRDAFDRSAPYKGIYGLLWINPTAFRTQTIKLQVSFRYLLNTGGSTVNFDTYFGYTMLAFWAWNEPSIPFKEIVHNPEAWIEWTDNGVKEATYKLGIEHESNGLAGKNSRGWNKIYAEVIDGWENDAQDMNSRYGLRLWRAIFVSGSSGHMVKHHALIGPYGYDAHIDLVDLGSANDQPYAHRGALRFKRTPWPTQENPGFLQLDLEKSWKNAIGHAQFFRGYGERLIPKPGVKDENGKEIYPNNGYRPIKLKYGISLRP